MKQGAISDLLSYCRSLSFFRYCGWYRGLLFLKQTIIQKLIIIKSPLWKRDRAIDAVDTSEGWCQATHQWCVYTVYGEWSDIESCGTSKQKTGFHWQPYNWSPHIIVKLLFWATSLTPLNRSTRFMYTTFVSLSVVVPCIPSNKQKLIDWMIDWLRL